MEFIPRPEDTKKFGLRWLKWNIYKYPNIALLVVPVPFIIYEFTKLTLKCNRGLASGDYAPCVVMNRYCIVRPDDYGAKITPSRYLN